MSDGDADEGDEAPRRSRTDDKRERVATEKALAELSERLLKVSSKVLATLELDDEAVQAVEDAKKIESAPARGRALRRVRSTLRDIDWVLLLRRLDVAAGGIAPTALREGEAAQHAALLSAQGDAGLARFVEEFPEADRSRLRQLIQNVRRSPEAKRDKTRRQLESAVQSAIDEHAARGKQG